MKKIRSLLTCYFLYLIFTLSGSVYAGEQILIGTGSKDGAHYYAGKAISRMINTKIDGLSCKALPTEGSLYNLDNVRDGGLDLAIVQSDLQYHAVKGTGPFEFMDGSYNNLRALFSLHSEPFTLIVRQDSGITRFEEIVGHRVNIGNPGSRHRATMDIVMDAMGWSASDFKLVEELNASEQSLALCNKRIDAMVYTVVHPNASIFKTVKNCQAKLISVSAPGIDTLVRTMPYYTHIHIPGNIYQGGPVKTFGVTATVMASTDLSTETVYNIVKALFDNFDVFRKLHPAFKTLEPKKMVRDGINVELHDGAKKYYKEKGLI